MNTTNLAAIERRHDVNIYETEGGGWASEIKGYFGRDWYKIGVYGTREAAREAAKKAVVDGRDAQALGEVR